MTRPSIAILGASSDRSKFGNKAVRAYLLKGYEVYPINPKPGRIEGLDVYHSLNDVPASQLDRVSVYLPPKITMQIIEDLTHKPAKEVWINPGSESPSIMQKAKSLGLNAIIGCSIVDLGINPADLD